LVNDPFEPLLILVKLVRAKLIVTFI